MDENETAAVWFSLLISIVKEYIDRKLRYVECLWNTLYIVRATERAKAYRRDLRSRIQPKKPDKIMKLNRQRWAVVNIALLTREFGTTFL